jgi:uncharacterized protein (TIGR00297 family)
VAVLLHGHIWCLRAWFRIFGLTCVVIRPQFSFAMSYLPSYPGLVLVHPAGKVAAFAALTLVFSVLGRVVRGVTTGGAIAGAAVCFALLWVAGLAGFDSLLTVFVLTWFATRVGYKHKQRLGTAEARTGRNALQVLANLGTPAGCAILYSTLWPDRRLLVAIAATLAEAAADTVSSEMGQALGGTPRLITTWKKVEPGTDGAITLAGTMDGATAAIAVGLVFAFTRILSWRLFAVCIGAGIAGMIFDSLLGATLERRRWLGNNTVNFASTVVAAGVAFLLA